MTTSFGGTQRQDQASDAAAYVYEPLPNDYAVRLIQICPDDTQPHGFSLIIQSFTLTQAPAFCCLSYTWKSAKFTRPSDIENDEDDDQAAVIITLYGEEKQIAISKNLFDFLRRARDKSWFTPEDMCRNSQDALQLNNGQTVAALPSYLWIDAISINQNDNRERSRQVSLMGTIYSLCQTVLVWLGKEDPSPAAKRVFCNFIPRFLALLESEGLELFRGKDPFCNDPELVRQLGEEICSQWREDWISFFLFLVQCRWFRRGWVVQEVVLRSLGGVSQVLVLCGSLGILWIDLSEFLARLTTLNWRATLTKRLRSHEMTKAWGYHFSDMLQSAMAVFGVGQLVKAYSFGQTTSSLLKRQFGGDMTSNERIYNIFFQFVTLLRLQKFSDKRDTFYGYLGLLAAVLAPGTSSPISADYNLSEVDVLTKEVWHMLSNMSYLDVLSMAQYKVTTADRPSWVPDFPEFPGATLREIRQAYQGPKFEASTTKSPCSLFSLTEGGGLTLVGTRVVNITMDGIQLYPNTTEFTSLETLLQILLGQQHDRVPKSERQDEAMCRTLIADTFPVSLNEVQYSSTFREWWTTALAKRIRLLISENDGEEEEILEILQELGSDWDWLPSIKEVLNAADNFGRGKELTSSPLEMVIHRLWAGRAFFQTEAGHFGLGPASLEVMDEVWLLKGGRTPFILRKRPGGNDYHFIGETYVHGLMYGEAVTPVLDQQMGPVTIF